MALLIAVLLTTLARVGLVDARSLVQDESAKSMAAPDPVESPIYAMAIAHGAEIALLDRYPSGPEFYDLRSRQRLGPGGLPARGRRTTAVALTGDGRTIGIGFVDGSILFRVKERSGVRDVVVTGHDGSVDSLDFSPDGLLAASSSNDGTVRIWDVAGRRVRHTLRLAGCSDGAHTHVVFSRDARFLAAASRSGSFSCWQTDDGRLVSHLSIAAGLRGLAFSADGASLVIANTSRRDVSLIDVRSGQELWRQTHPEAGVMYTSVAVSPDGRWLAAGDASGWLHLLAPATGDAVRSFEVHDANVAILQYSPDGTVLYSASHDGRIGIWKVRELAGESRRSDALCPKGLPVQRSSRETPGNSKTKSGPYAVEAV